MTVEQWQRKQKLGWCRQDAFITEQSCFGRQKAEKKSIDNPRYRDVSGSVLAGCAGCAGLDFSRQRDNADDPKPMPAEPLQKHFVIEEPVMKKPKVVNICKTLGCMKRVARMGLCRACLEAKGLDPQTGLPVRPTREEQESKPIETPFDAVEAMATSEKMAATLKQLEEFTDAEQIRDRVEEMASVLDSQIGGDHYRKLGEFQPWSVLKRWMTPDELRGFAKGTAIVYCARERDKGGDEDIRKAIHTLQIYLELSNRPDTNLAETVRAAGAHSEIEGRDLPASPAHHQEERNPSNGPMGETA